MSTDRETPQPAPPAGQATPAMLHVYKSMPEQDGVYLIAELVCAAISAKPMHLVMDTKTGELALALPCGCRSAISLSALAAVLQGKQACGKPVAGQAVH